MKGAGLAYVWLKTMDGFERLEKVLATYGTYKYLYRVLLRVLDST